MPARASWHCSSLKACLPYFTRHAIGVLPDPDRADSNGPTQDRYVELAVKAGDAYAARETLRSALIRARADRGAWRAAANVVGNEGPLRRLA